MGRSLYWQTQDRKTLKRINTLIEDTLRDDPFEALLTAGPRSASDEGPPGPDGTGRHSLPRGA